VFVAGPYVVTYQARSTTDDVPVGIRCVKFANLTERPGVPGVAFVWYGEGVVNGVPFRHFGEAFRTGAGRVLPGHAVDLPGTADPAAMTLSFTIPTAGVPDRIAVSGDRSEHWERIAGTVAQDYRSSLPPLGTGGDLVREYTVRDRDGTPGHGIRCLLSSGSWLGAGQWRGVPYLHPGYLHRRPERTGPTSALRRRRHLPPTGILRIRAVGKIAGAAGQSGRPIEREVLGRWTEDWRLRHPAQGWRPAAEVAHLAVDIEP
jgi:hypothetical protein